MALRALALWALLVSKWVPLAPLLVACSLMRGAAPARRLLGVFAYGVMWQWRLEVEERRGRRRLTHVAGQWRAAEEWEDPEIFNGFDWVPNPSSSESRGWVRVNPQVRAHPSPLP